MVLCSRRNDQRGLHDEKYLVKPGDVHVAALPWVEAELYSCSDEETRGLPLEDGAGLVGDDGDLVLDLYAGPLPGMARTIWGDKGGFEAHLKAGWGHPHEDTERRFEPARNLLSDTVERRGTTSCRTQWNGDLNAWKKIYFPLMYDQGGSCPSHDKSEWGGKILFFQGDAARMGAPTPLHINDRTGGVPRFLLCGRSDDVLNVGGNRFGTGQIETALLLHARDYPNSDLLNAVVCGSPDPIKGEVAAAFLLLKNKKKLGQLCGELQTLVSDMVGPLAAPQFFFVVEQFPETISGKYVRRLLRSIVSEETARIRKAEAAQHILCTETAEVTAEVEGGRAAPTRSQNMSTVRNAASIDHVRDVVRATLLAKRAGDLQNESRADDVEACPKNVCQKIVSLLREETGLTSVARENVPLMHLGLDSTDLRKFRDRIVKDLGHSSGEVFSQLFGYGGFETLSCADLARRLLPRLSDNEIASRRGEDHDINHPRSVLVEQDQLASNGGVVHEDVVPREGKSSAELNATSSSTSSRTTPIISNTLHSFEQQLSGSERATSMSFLMSTLSEACRVGDIPRLVQTLEEALALSFHTGPCFPEKLLEVFELVSRVRCPKGSTALHYAATGGHLVTAKGLLEGYEKVLSKNLLRQWCFKQLQRPRRVLWYSIPQHTTRTLLVVLVEDSENKRVRTSMMSEDAWTKMS